MRRWMLGIVLAGCGDEAFTTVQPEPFWVDLTGAQVTRGSDLEYIDDRDIVWQIDWRSASLAGLPFPTVVYADDACAGRPYLIADVPPLHAMWDAGEEGWKVVRADARVQRIDDGFAKVGGCSKVVDLPVVYDLRDAIDLPGTPMPLPYVPPLRKVLPAGEP